MQVLTWIGELFVEFFTMLKGVNTPLGFNWVTMLGALLISSLVVAFIVRIMEISKIKDKYEESE